VNTLAILDVGASTDADNVSNADAKIVAHHFIHEDLLIGHGVIRQNDADLRQMNFEFEKE
jgi:hypothetical protein